MTKRERKKPFSLDMGFEEALERFATTSPGEVADAIARDLAREMRNTKERIRTAREEIELGARTRRQKERFRL